MPIYQWIAFMKMYGFSLIEIMISSFILALGFLGLAGMQSTAIKSTIEIEQRTLANSLVADITERMKLNRLWLQQSGNNYAINSLMDSELSVPSCIGAGGVFNNCSGLDIKNNDLYECKQKFIGAYVNSSSDRESGLVDADACIEVQSSGKNIIVLSWYSTVKSKDAAADYGETDLRTKCGNAGQSRRQLKVETFVGKAS